MERKIRNVVAALVVFVGLLLMPVLFAGCLPTAVDYDCTAVRTDTLDSFASGDSLTGDIHCEKR